MGSAKLVRSLVLWLSFLVLYLLFATSLEPSELAAGAVFATLVLAAFSGLRRSFAPLLRVKRRWLLPVLKIPWAMFHESWLLCLALVRRLAGRQVEGTFLESHSLAADDACGQARRTLLTFGVCITPNSYLVYLDPKRRFALVRQLVGKEISRMDRDFLELP